MNLSRTVSSIASRAGIAMAAVVAPAVAFASEGAASGDAGTISIGVAILLGLAAAGGTTAQGRAVSSAVDSIGRNPGAAGQIFKNLILGLALIESLVVLSFVVANSLAGKF